MSGKDVKRSGIYFFVIAIFVISLCPSIAGSNFNEDAITKDVMISEMKLNTLEEPIFFNIEETLETLPKNIIEMIYEEGVKIEITDKIGEKSKYGRVTSKYIHKSKRIMLQQEYSNNMVLLHEIGHAYSYNKIPIIKISDTNRFREIYLKEKDILFPDGGKFIYKNFNVRYDYVKVNAEEYFAQCFAMYFTGALKESTETYSYIKKITGH